MKWASRLIGIFLCVALSIVVTGCHKGGIEPIELEGLGTEIEMEAEGEAPSEAVGEKNYKIGGNVSGLSGTLVLQNNGADDLNISADGTFTFATALADGASYAVTIATQPTAQTCYVKNDTGTVAGVDVTDVDVKCYNPGSLDPAFGSSGVVVSADTAGEVGGNDWGKSITIDANDKILVTGYSKNNAGDYDMMIWRYNEDGSLDPAFDSDGIVMDNNAAGGNGHDLGNSITMYANGKILVAGESYGGNQKHYDMAIWRYNANGTADNSFNGTGTVTHHDAAGGNGNDVGNSIAIDLNGKIVVAGNSGNNANNLDMVIWRYDNGGTLDASFNVTGIVAHNNAAGGNGDDFGYSVTTDANGKILVAGKSWNGSNYDMVIWRYKNNGTLDTTFNLTGIVTHHNAAGGNGDDAGNSITIDSNGKILVAGESKNSAGDLDMVIWRYNENGTLDTTFNASGPKQGIAVSHNAAGGNGTDRGLSLTIDAEGRVLVTGNSISVATSADMVIWRYKKDGTPDTDFGSNGIVINAGAAGGTKEDWGNSITLDAKGRILVTGLSKNASGDSDMAIWRYMP